MSDGVQTLLDVIEDPTVLDSFFNVPDAYTPVQNLDSPGFDNAAVADSSFVNNSLDSLGFDSLCDPYRSAGHPILQQAINNSLAVGGSASHQLFSHQLYNDILQTPHHPGQTTTTTTTSQPSPIAAAAISHDINRQREACSHPDSDQTTLQQLLSASNPLVAQQQQQQQLQQLQHLQIPLHHQHSHSTTTATHVTQGGASGSSMSISHNTLLQQQSHPIRLQQNHAGRLSHYMQSLGSENGSVELNQNVGHITDCSNTSSSSARAITAIQQQQQQSLGVQDTTSSHSDSVSLLPSTKTVVSSVSGFSGGGGKVQIIGGGGGGGQSQLLPPNIFAAAPNIAAAAGQCVLSSAGSLLPTCGTLLPAGQPFAAGNIVRGTQILANVMSPVTVTSGGGGVVTSSAVVTAVQPQSHNCDLSAPAAAQSTVMVPSVSPISTVANASALSLLTSASCVTPRATATISHVTPKAAIQTAAPQSTVITQAVISSSSDGVVNHAAAGLKAARVGLLQQANMSTTTQVSSSSVKQQVVAAGQVIHLVGGTTPQPQPRTSIIHPAPKPIQPKPHHLLPKPVTSSCVVRQPTPPPAGKTFIGTRPITPSNQQQPLIIGTNPQQQTMIGHNQLGGIMLNSGGYFSPTYILPQGAGGGQLFVKLGPQAGNQTILTSMANASLMPMNKMSQPQSTIMLPPAGAQTQQQSLVLPQGIATYPTGNIFGPAQVGPQRSSQQQSLVRYVTQPPLQIQQFQTPNGPTLIAVPQQQQGLSILAAPQTSVRTISPQVAQAPFQLAPMNALSTANLGSLQLPTAHGGFQGAVTSQALQQVSAASLMAKTSAAGIQQTILLNHAPIVTAPSVVPKDAASSGGRSSEKARKSGKKKKKAVAAVAVEPKEVTTTTSINLNDILKESGIDNDMMFDESEFGMTMEPTPQSQQPAAAVAAVASTNAPQSMVSGNVATTSSLCLRPTTNPPAVNPVLANVPTGISGLPINMCLALDMDGKIVLAHQDINKTLYLPQQQQQSTQQSQLPLQNIQMVPSTATPSVPPADTLILGGVNDRSLLPPLPCQSEQLVKLLNQSDVTQPPLMKIASPPQFTMQFKRKASAGDHVTNLTNRHSGDKSAARNATNITSVLTSDVRPNGFQPQTVKTTTSAVSKIQVAHKNSSPPNLSAARSMLSAVTCEASNAVLPAVKNGEPLNKTVMAPVQTTKNPPNTFNAISGAVDSKNTYQYKYIESVKQPLITENPICKPKKSSSSRKSKRKDQEESVDHLVVFKRPAANSPRKTEDLVSPGASMPSFSFPSTPMFPPNPNAVAPPEPPVAVAAAAAKVLSAPAPPSGSYIVSGTAGLRSTCPPTQRPRQTCQTIQVMMSPHNQEMLKKVGAQMQALKTKAAMTEHDKLIWQKLATEYNRIISLAKPVPTPVVAVAAAASSTTNNVAANTRNSIQYSHSIGHKKILLTPTSQKKAISPSAHVSKEPPRDSFRNEQLFPCPQTSVQTSPAAIPYPTPSTTAIVPTNSIVTRTSLPDYRLKDSKFDSGPPQMQSQTNNFVCPLGFIAPAATLKDGFGKSGGMSPPAQRRTSGPHQTVTVSEFVQTSPQRQTNSEPTSEVTMDKLFLHQMKTDQNGASNPDCNTPFKYRPSACKRLIRYHVWDEPNASIHKIDEEERKFVAQAELAAKKLAAMMRKYQSLTMKDSMLRFSSAEQAMLLRLVNQEEKSITEKDKLEGRRGQELTATLVDSQRRTIASSYLDGHPWEDTWGDDLIYIKNPFTDRLEKVNKYHQDRTPERPESGEPRLQILMDEEVDRDTPRSAHQVDLDSCFRSNGNVDRVPSRSDQDNDPNYYQSNEFINRNAPPPRSEEEEVANPDTPPSADESISMIAKKIGLHEFSSTESGDTCSPFLRDSDHASQSTSYAEQERRPPSWNEQTSSAVVVANGGNILTSSSESPYDVSSIENDTDSHASSAATANRRDRKRRNKSKHRDKPRRSTSHDKRRGRSKRPSDADLASLQEEEECGPPESPSSGPIKLVLKKTHAGQGYYSSSSSHHIHPPPHPPPPHPPPPHATSSSCPSTSGLKRRRVSLQRSPPAITAITPVVDHPSTADRGYGLNNYYGLENANYTYRCS